VQNWTDGAFKFEWDVLETKALAAEAAKNFTKQNLNFYGDFKEIVNKNYDIVLASGSIQCLDKPEEFFSSISSLNYRFMIINRFPHLV
ncbi:hypothetical protein, partial [Sabulibacter ruber]